MTEVKKHPFSPASDGRTCNEMQYPAYKRCEKGPKSRVHDGTRPAPPGLEFPYPPCSLCGEDTYWDEGFRCDPCGASWDDKGNRGAWDEPDLKACGATRTPYDRDDLEAEFEKIRHHRDYCIRAKDHDGKHRADSWAEWA